LPLRFRTGSKPPCWQAQLCRSFGSARFIYERESWVPPESWVHDDVPGSALPPLPVLPEDVPAWSSIRHLDFETAEVERRREAETKRRDELFPFIVMEFAHGWPKWTLWCETRLAHGLS